MDLYFSLLAQFIIYTLLIISLNNFIIGKLEIWAIGHIAFMGIGAFITGTLSVNFNINPLISILLACCIGLLASLFIGVTTLRLKGDFFIILSIAFSELVRALLIEINGPTGLTGVARPVIFGLRVDNNFQFTIYILVPILVITMFLAKAIKNSRLESIAKLIRQSETLSAMLKIPVFYYKIGFFSIGSLLATLVGGLYALYIRGTDPSVLIIYDSILIFTMVMLGGLNSISGSIIGGIIFIFLPLGLEYVINRPDSTFYATQLSHLIFGILLVLIVLKYPAGVMGENLLWRK